MSGELQDEQRDRVRSAQVLREYTYPRGAKRYLLTWSDFIEHWESLRTVHRETMRPVVMKPPRSRGHRTDAIDFLNGILGRKLLQPGYVGLDDAIDPNGPKPGHGGFRALTESLQGNDLLFSQELVANYILALQTKRFAILTGISGTGKTKIAMAVAEHFRPVLKRTVANEKTIPDDAVGTTAKTLHVQVLHDDLTPSRWWTTSTCLAPTHHWPNARSWCDTRRARQN